MSYNKDIENIICIFVLGDFVGDIFWLEIDIVFGVVFIC